MVNDDKKVLLVAQEIKLAKILAGNNKKLRERTLKKLGKWLEGRSINYCVDEDVFMRIWKGLFYSMWMSDKPLLQEDCAEKIAQLVHLKDAKTSLLFFKCFLQTMANEWFGIDQHRIDKFLMLVRRVFRQTFEVLKKFEWSDEDINTFREILNQTAFKIDKSTALSLVLHIDEIFLEELAKVSKGKLDGNKLLELIQPFAQQLARLDDFRHLKHLSQHIFKYLMEQSDVGIEYKEKFHVWKRQGFPGGTMDSLEKVEIRNDATELSDNNETDDEEVEDQPKDPRAGKVDVLLPQLQFDPLAIAALLNDLKFKKYTTTLGRKHITTLIEQFNKLAKGVYPLGATKVATVPKDGHSTKLKVSLKRLERLDEKVGKTSKKIKQKKARQQKVQQVLAEQIQQASKKLQQSPKINSDKIQQAPKINSNNIQQPPKTNSDKNKSKLKKPKVSSTPKKSKQFDETSNNDFMNFVQKSESKLMEAFNKQTKKRKQTKEFVENPVKKFKTNSLLNTSDFSTLPTNYVNTFVRNSGKWVVEEFDLSIPKPKKSKKVVDQADEWSKPLQNGETEYFVVSSKTKKKLKRLADSKNYKSGIVKNPFSVKNVPKPEKSGKKIKFSDNNQTQDFSDHLKQIFSSPGIPYDSRKQPKKPLLKASPLKSPINPFYKQKS